MRLKDKVVVVTGGGSGMGRELVLGLIDKGATVAAVDLNETTLNETADLVPADKKDQISTFVLNTTDQALVEALPQKVMEQHGSVDGLINNAGIIQPFVRVNKLDYETINRVFNVNFFGTLYMTKAFLPYLLKRPEAHILNVSSMGGFLPVPGQTLYGASKAAVKLLTEGLQSELSGTNVHVTVVFPGAVATNIEKNSGVESPVKSNDADKQQMQTLPATKAAQIMINGMERNKTRVFVGKDSRMLNIFYRFSPTMATNMITKQMKSFLPD